MLAISVLLCTDMVFYADVKMWKRSTNTNHNGNWYYRLKISGRSDLTAFLSEVGFQFPRKNDVLKDKLNYKENTNADLIPVNKGLFKSKRVGAGLSQKQFASKIGCSYSMISAIELGKRNVQQKFIQ